MMVASAFMQIWITGRVASKLLPINSMAIEENPQANLGGDASDQEHFEVPLIEEEDDRAKTEEEADRKSVV